MPAMPMASTRVVVPGQAKAAAVTSPPQASAIRLSEAMARLSAASTVMTSPAASTGRCLVASQATPANICSEIAAADFAHLESISDGSYRYTLAHSKTNQAGARRPQDLKPNVGQAARALTAWLEVLEEQGIERRGRVFRRMLRGGFVAGPMTPHAVREIVRNRCEVAGLHVEDFSAHSLRSGFLTEAGRRGVPLKAAMDMSGHTSVNTAMGYMRAGELANEPTARFLDED